MNDKKQKKLIKIILVSMLIGFILIIIIEELINDPGHLFDGGDSEKILIKSGFGTIQLNDNDKINDQINPLNPVSSSSSLSYIDDELGFSISRPNLQWDFNIDNPETQDTPELTQHSFLGGLHVEQEFNQMIFVGVFDAVDFGEFVLEDYAQTQIDTMMKKYDTNVTIKNFSQDNTWAIFGMIVNSEGNLVYGEQILVLQNEKLYMLQYTGNPPELFDNEKREEIRKIIDSFIILEQSYYEFR